MVWGSVVSEIVGFVVREGIVEFGSCRLEWSGAVGGAGVEAFEAWKVHQHIYTYIHIYIYIYIYNIYIYIYIYIFFFFFLILGYGESYILLICRIIS